MSRAEAMDPRWVRRLALVSVAAAALPIVVAAVRAVADDWVPVGENAYFELRARDVLTGHHPWLGSWTSASAEAGVDMNNPGPLYFELLAVPTKLGADAGLVVGVALINVAAVVGIALVVRRVAGFRGVLAAMLAATGLVWAMGSEMLFDPWQPHSLVLPVLCLLTMAWALAAGDLVMLPWLSGLSTFVVQTHMGYALIVPLVVGWAVAVAGLRVRRSRRDDADGWPELRGRVVRYAGIAAVVAVVGWSQTVYEQLFGPGQGNLSRLADGARTSQPRVGLERAPSFVANVVALPPWWGRPSFRDAFSTLERDPMPTTLVAIASLVVVVALLVGGAVLVHRRSADGRAAVLASATAVMAVVVSVIGATTMPMSPFGVVPHHMRWLWPVAVFATFAIVLLGLEALGQRRSAAVGVGALGVFVLLLSGLSLPSMNARGGEANNAAAMPVVRELRPQLGVLRGERGVLIDTTRLRFGEWYAWPVMSELQELGVPFYIDNSTLVRQAGPERAWPGDATVRLILREGGLARAQVDGAERIAYARADLPDSEAAELDAVRDELRPFIAGGGLRLADDPDGQPRERTLTVEVSDAQLRDPDHLFAVDPSSGVRPLLDLVRTNRLDVPGLWRFTLNRYSQLQVRADQLEVGVFVERLEAA